MTVTDDDSLSADDMAVLTVTNEAPVHGLDRVAALADGDAFETAGGTTWFTQTADPVTLETDANDVGSDDLRMRWWIDLVDVTDPPDLTEWFVAATDSIVVGSPGSDADVSPSPAVDPSRSAQPVGVLDRTKPVVTSEFTAAPTEPCLYGISVDVTDDDGGQGGLDHASLIVQRNRADGDDQLRNFGALKSMIDDGVITQDQVRCYLDMAGHLSAVLLGTSEIDGDDGVDETPWTTRNGVTDITELDGVQPWLFTTSMGTAQGKLAKEQLKLDRSLLAAWFNFADGAVGWETELETGIPFWQTIAEVEAVRLDMASSPERVADARRRLWQIGLG